MTSLQVLQLGYPTTTASAFIIVVALLDMTSRQAFAQHSNHSTGIAGKTLVSSAAYDQKFTWL